MANNEVLYKAFAAMESLLTVWWRMLVSWAEIGAASCLLAQACLSASGGGGGGRGLYAASYLSCGIRSILCSVSGQAVS